MIWETRPHAAATSLQSTHTCLRYYLRTNFFCVRRHEFFLGPVLAGAAVHKARERGKEAASLNGLCERASEGSVDVVGRAAKTCVRNEAIRSYTFLPIYFTHSLRGMIKLPPSIRKPENDGKKKISLSNR